MGWIGWCSNCEEGDELRESDEFDLAVEYV